MISAIRDARAGNTAASNAQSSRVGDGVQRPARRPRGQLRPHAGELFPPDGRHRHHRAVAGRRGGLRPAEARSRRAVARPRHARATSTARPRSARRGTAICRSSASASGLQALAEAYGGELRQLHVPMHGKPSRIRVSKPGIIFSGLPKEVTVGRYHSIFADPVRLPDDFVVTAETEDGIIMAFEHKQGADRSGAVSSGIDHDTRPECRHAHHREHRGSPATQGQGQGGLTGR